MFNSPNSKLRTNNLKKITKKNSPLVLNILGEKLKKYHPISTYSKFKKFKPKHNKKKILADGF